MLFFTLHTRQNMVDFIVDFLSSIFSFYIVKNTFLRRIIDKSLHFFKNLISSQHKFNKSSYEID